MPITAQHIAINQFNKLIKEYPEQEEPGGDLFLGKHFAANKILHLGINPGGTPEIPSQIQTELLTENELLKGNSGERYWNGAASILTATPALKYHFEKATFSFCCPFRTKEWGGEDLPVKKMRALLRHSKPIVESLLDESNFKYVVLTGVAAKNILLWDYRDLFSSTIKTQKPILYNNQMQWSSQSVVYKGREINVIQVPHYSRTYGNSHWGECIEWLSEQLTG